MLNGYVVDAAPVSFKALLLAMCLAAAVSMPLVQQKELEGINIQSVVGRLKLATEKALTDANFTNPVEIQILQAFTIYLVGSCPACRFIESNRNLLTDSRSHSVAQKFPSRIQSMSTCSFVSR